MREQEAWADSLVRTSKRALLDLAVVFSSEILPQENGAGPAPCQAGGDFGGSLVGGADGLHHRG